MTAMKLSAFKKNAAPGPRAASTRPPSAGPTARAKLKATELRVTASAVRSLVTDNRLIYDVVEKNPKTGRHETRRIEKMGPTGLITTSTKSLTTQMSTRALEVPLRDDADQTSAKPRT